MSRPTARVLVLDPSDRILLMKGTTAWAPGVWFTPGGGVRPEETLEHFFWLRVPSVRASVLRLSANLEIRLA